MGIKDGFFAEIGSHEHREKGECALLAKEDRQGHLFFDGL